MFGNCQRGVKEMPSKLDGVQIGGITSDSYGISKGMGICAQCSYSD